jgi:hypothetical protein
MKKINIAFIGIIFVAVAMLTACKKDKEKDPTTTTKTKPSDQQGSTEADAAIDDVNDFINNKIGGGSNHKSSTYNLPCGVVYIDSSTNNSNGHKIYKMNYGSQTPCGYKKKSGTISFALLNSSAFNTVGSTYKLTYTNYVVESLVDGSTVMINGYLTVKNVNGGYIWEAVTMSSTITYQLRGIFTVTYTDGTSRERRYFQLRTYSSTSAPNDWSGLNLSCDGDTIINSANIYEMGFTYDGDYSYRTEIITPFLWSNCGSTYAGPYVLKTAHAKMNVIIPFISPTYVDIQGGYYWDYSNSASTPVLVEDCSTNAYKITTVIGTSSVSQYQLY